MASLSEEDFSCPACHDIFKDPVLLSCSHSFCKACLQKWWSDKQTHECPVCRTKSDWSDPRCNLVLKNLCEAFLLHRRQSVSSQSEALCSLHAEKLKLFCLDHQQPACLVCRDAKIHTDHKFRPIDEAAQDNREEVQNSLKPLQKKLTVFNQVKANWDHTAEHIKAQARHTEWQIRRQFKQLYQFLQEEEEARVAALKEEEKQKSQVIKEKAEALSRDIAALSETVKATEEELKAGDVLFLKNYKATVERIQQCPLLDDPERQESGALIDVAKHLGNLTFNIWNKMKDMVSYSPVILDPNTAHPELILSDDLTGVRHGKRRQLPENPERFEYWDSVLGSGFNSGTHSWDVEIGANADWELGLLAESVCRKVFTGSMVWSVEHNDAGYRAFCPTHKYTALPVRETLRAIRVHLDWDKGQLSFSDPHTDTHIHTFTHTFTERLFPYLCTRNTIPLRILPVKITVERHY
ncbi:E3 ubiquitin-protein ligase TRIM35-like [Scomber scombrus]|uniref:E3 ubiquitin-protein ligase TRIM35-like n=1 Tax=Scomber scombrus TaxID=13677 RepID=UPI002DD9F8A7|nr:E3 ubiquitin-protein ligase TRIM35-like [Scomber scombrus]